MMSDIKVFGFLLALMVVSSCVKKRQAEPEVVMQYACPMHPKQVFNKPGQCPICKMDLVKISPAVHRDSAVMLSENQRLLAGINTIVVHSGSVGNDLVFAGRLVPDPALITKISARVGGRIEKLFYRETGVPINSGEPLYEIYSEELQNLQREYLAVENDASLSRSAEQRLILAGMTTNQVNQLKVDRKILPRTTILSPVSGTIAEIAVQQGQYAADGATLYTIGGLAKLWAEIEFYPGESGLVHLNDDAMVSIAGFSESLRTKIIFLEPQYRSSSQILLARAIINNPQLHYTAGTEIRITLLNKGTINTVIPSSAIVHGTECDHVWTENNDGSFSMRAIITGREAEMKTEIVRGLSVGDHVVVAGSLLLDAEWSLRLGQDINPSVAAVQP